MKTKYLYFQQITLLFYLLVSLYLYPGMLTRRYLLHHSMRTFIKTMRNILYILFLDQLVIQLRKSFISISKKTYMQKSCRKVLNSKAFGTRLIVSYIPVKFYTMLRREKKQLYL